MDAQNDLMAERVRAAFAEEVRELLARANAIPAQTQEALAADGDGLRQLQRILHTLKGAAAAVGNEDLHTAVHGFEDEIGASESRDGGLAPEWLLERIDALAALAGLAGEAEAAAPRPIGAAPDAAPKPVRAHPGESVRVVRERVDSLQVLVDDLVVLRLRQEALAREMRMLVRMQGAAWEGWRQLPVAARRDGRGFESDLREVARTAKRVSSEASVLASQITALTGSLDEAVRDLRLVPMQGALEALGASVRDAARRSGKQVRFEVDAEGVEIDRAVLERLTEPLLHLVRNAVAHGIETPEQRARVGKDPVGTIRLEGAVEGGAVLLRITDDGRGIDAKAVCARVAGAAAEGAEREMEDDELLQCITSPGFSTASTTDELAGRGVGLDVVSATVDLLGGGMTLDNLPGAGCVFTLKVPVRSSTGHGLVLQVAGFHCCLLVRFVERVLRIAPGDAQVIEGRTAIPVAGQLVGLLPLGGMLGLDQEPWEEKRPAIVLRVGKRRLAVRVDDILGDQPLVIKPLPSAFTGGRLFGGGAVNADNSVLPLLEAAALLDLAERGQVRESIAAPKDVEAPEVLVVDDSVTMRTMEKGILTAAGYAVTAAASASQALELFSRMGECRLVITDLEMPGMDGVELCRQLRVSARPHVPILMVTSVGDPAERRKALEAGADAYLIKGDFAQDGFLQQVSRLVGRSAGV